MRWHGSSMRVTGIFPARRRSSSRAIELNPNNATARSLVRDVSGAEGRTDESLAAMRQAKSLDPFSPIVNRWR